MSVELCYFIYSDSTVENHGCIWLVFSILIPMPISHFDTDINSIHITISTQPYCPGEAVLNWKVETCDQGNCILHITTACTVIKCTGHNNGNCHGASWGSIHMWNFILLEYTGILWIVCLYFAKVLLHFPWMPDVRIHKEYYFEGAILIPQAVSGQYWSLDHIMYRYAALVEI